MQSKVPKYQAPLLAHPPRESTFVGQLLQAEVPSWERQVVHAWASLAGMMQTPEEARRHELQCWLMLDRLEKHSMSLKPVVVPWSELFGLWPLLMAWHLLQLQQLPRCCLAPSTLR